MVKQIPLTQGKVALVDDVDYDVVIQFSWYAARNSNGLGWYAQTIICGKTVQLHRMLMCEPEREVDHQNGDGLDCRRMNLRECTLAENRRNRPKKATNTSGYKGVHACGSRWRAQICIDRKKIHIGVFVDIVCAAHAYDAAAVKYHGEFARLNFPNSA